MRFVDYLNDIALYYGKKSGKNKSIFVFLQDVHKDSRKGISFYCEILYD